MAVGQRVDPRRFRWTRKAYYRLSELGFFRGRRVQLIGGEILEMAAQKNFHPLSVTLTQRALEEAFGPDFWVRNQASLDLSPHSVPDPDLAVVPGTPRDYLQADNPTTALLIVEVSDTTLRFDQGRKASLYARAGIADYWIVDLVHHCLEVRRDPVPDSAAPFAFRYDNLTILAPTDTVSPLAAPQAQITVADLLP